MAKDPNKIKQAIGKTRERMGDAVDAIVNKSDVTSRVSETLGDTADALRTRLQTGADAFSDAADRTRLQLPDVEPLRRGARNPIAVIIGIAAVGFIAGLLVPLSDAERVRLEPIGEDLAQRASDARDEIVAQGRQVVAETVSAARGSVQKHGEELASNLGVDAVASQEAATTRKEGSAPNKPS